MAKNIEPKLKKIGDYLKLDEEVNFLIPEYQRAYSWGIEHCDKLWNDIILFSEGDNKDSYFFGTIIINCQDEDKSLGLIDGQQRTTTFLLLLKALLIRINNVLNEISNDDESASLRSGLEERRRQLMGILCRAEAENVSNIPDIDKDKELVKNAVILVNNSINEQYEDDLTTILQSVDFDQAEQRVIKIPYKQKDNKYTNFFKNFKFFYEQASELSETNLNTIAKTVISKCEVIEIKSWQVEQAITMFNSLNSDGLPLNDSDIISAKLYAVAESLNKKEEFVGLWEDLKNQIEILSRNKIATIDSVLMQKMYYERTINGDTISNTGSIDVTVPGVRRYYIDLNKNLINNPIDLTKDMIKIAAIWNKISYYPCVQVLLKLNENAKLFLTSYFKRYNVEDITEERITVVVECLIRLFVIVELTDIGYSSKYFKTFLFGEEVRLINPNILDYEIKNDFDNHINKNWNRDIIKNAILDYDKHMLVYVNEYLYAKENDMIFDLTDKYDIEHIMPLSGKNHSSIRSDADIASEEEFKDIVNKLGNKIVLEESINRSIGNEWFRSKLSNTIEDKKGYVNSKFPLAKALVERYKFETKPYWKKDDINKATQKAADRIIKFIFEG
ncbi:MAG: DUF262 domain-containing protein [Clostridia bacterium]|nr:DUF262 domain-containing protein [Clostridia bacterium]